MVGELDIPGNLETLFSARLDSLPDARPPMGKEIANSMVLLFIPNVLQAILILDAAYAGRILPTAQH